MRRPSLIGRLTAIAVLLAASAGAQDETLTRAKDYYASASYDDALRVLEQLRTRPAGGTPEVAAYQMFCLVALGREQQAREAVEQIVRVDPLYRPPVAETSPRIRTFFEDVRRPLLPAVIRERYAAARALLDRGDRAAASAEFDRIMALIDEFGGTADDSLADLRLLVSGFRDLAKSVPSPDARSVEAARSASPTPSSSAEPAAPPADAKPADDRALVYGSKDVTVTPPVAISRELPVWHPINAIDRIRSYRGTIEFVVDESGKVASIGAIQGVHVNYAEALVRATERWRFKPALRAGVPVQYRLSMEILLAASRP